MNIAILFLPRGRHTPFLLQNPSSFHKTRLPCSQLLSQCPF